MAMQAALEYNLFWIVISTHVLVLDLNIISLVINMICFRTNGCELQWQCQWVHQLSAHLPESHHDSLHRDCSGQCPRVQPCQEWTWRSDRTEAQVKYFWYLVICFNLLLKIVKYFISAGSQSLMSICNFSLFLLSDAIKLCSLS